MRKLGAIASTALLLVPLTLPLGGCDFESLAKERGPEAQRGAEVIASAGCGTCHTIPGIEGADGLVGPPLTQMAKRSYIAGVLRNTPVNMDRWLANPQAIVPGNAMPDLNLTPDQRQAIVAYLDTLQ